MLQREVPEEINLKAGQLAKDLGIKVILDMGGEDTQISKALLSTLDIISPNKTELKRILHKEIDTEKEESLIEAVKEIRDASGNPNLCLLLKSGSKGCIYVDENNKIIKQSALQSKEFPIVDTTGAGI